MKYIINLILLGTLLLAPFTHANETNTWTITDSIPLDTIVVNLLKDPQRNYLYAIDRTDSKVLFIDLDSKLINKLYVGKLPTSIVINDAGDKLYVANGGTGAGLSGDYQIAVVDIATQTKSHHFLTTSKPVNLVMGLSNRLYYNNGSWDAGAEISTGGSTGIIDLETETQLRSIGFSLKSRMVVNDDRTKLYAQYVYSGNLGKMGVFDVENIAPFKLDESSYSPYPYGWDYNNYTISADGNRLAYGKVLFNADNLIIQYGVFSELIHALNSDGSVAFGKNSIWDTSTFSTSGDASELFNHNLESSVMTFNSVSNTLYAFTPTDYSIKKLEPIDQTPSANAPVVSIESALVLKFETQKGARYYVQESSDMNSWTNLWPGIYGDGSTRECFFETTSSNKFYRVNAEYDE
jgi:DNA-binding beta-propeller fold protein YncE